MWESSVFQGRQPRPYPKRLGPGVPKFWDLLHAGTVYENSNQILHGDQTICVENFHKIDHALLCLKLLKTRMLMRDLFAVVITQWLFIT